MDFPVQLQFHEFEMLHIQINSNLRKTSVYITFWKNRIKKRTKVLVSKYISIDLIFKLLSFTLFYFAFM